MSRKEYVCKMKNFLNDRSNFQNVHIHHSKILNHLTIWKIEYQMFLKVFETEEKSPLGFKPFDFKTWNYVSGIYSSTDWPPFTGGQNSILSWVLKLNPLNQKNQKSNKNCLDCLERALFIYFLPLGVMKKSVQKKRVCVCVRQTSVSATFLLNKITVKIFQIIHIQNKTLNPCMKGGLEQRCRIQTRLQGLFTFWNQCQREKKPRE